MADWSFVTDMATASPATLLNLNAAPYFVGSDFRLDPPAFSKSRVGGLLPGDRVTNSRPGNRTLSLPIHLLPTATPGQDIENLCEQLAVDNILRVRLGTNPVFFRTFGNPGIENAIRALFKQTTTISLEIEAEPYAYGVREELSGSPFTVSNNPAAATNPCFFDATGILGDAPTPLLLLATSTGAAGAPSGLVSKQIHLATRRRGTPGNYSNVMQAEAMTAVSADTTVTADAAMSGGSKLRCTFATTAALALRASDTFPANGTATVEARGEYRVYARLQRTDNTSVINAQLRYGSSSANVVSNDVMTLPLTTNPFYQDLGKIPVPAFADGYTMGFSGVQTKVLMSFVGLYLQRVSGTANVDIDHLYFMPADEPTTLIAAMPATDTTYAIDGTTEAGGAVYALNTALDQQLEVGTPPRIVGGGGFPALIPGVANRIHMLRNVDPAGSLDAIGNTTTWRAFYWPRWLEPIRP